MSQDNNLFWVVFSSAEDSVPDGVPKNTLKLEFLEVVKYLKLGSEQFHINDLRVRNFDKVRQNILDKLVNIKKTFKPDLVIGPSLNDFHQDHQVVANEMVRAFKTTASIISYELPWNHIIFSTQLFIKLNDKEIMTKWEMLKKYKSQISLGRSYFSKDYIRSIAKVRGLQCNAKYAE